MPATVMAFIIAQSPELPGQPFTSVGALIALVGVIVWTFRTYIPRLMESHQATISKICATHEKNKAVMDKSLDHMTERMDTWEKQRHEDSQQLNTTLMTMTKNCAAHQAQVESLRQQADS